MSLACGRTRSTVVGTGRGRRREATGFESAMTQQWYTKRRD